MPFYGRGVKFSIKLIIVSLDTYRARVVAQLAGKDAKKV